MTIFDAFIASISTNNNNHNNPHTPPTRPSLKVRIPLINFDDKMEVIFIPRNASQSDLENKDNKVGLVIIIILKFSPKLRFVSTEIVPGIQAHLLSRIYGRNLN